MGDPIQSDELRIEHDQGEVEIVVYNRAILLFRTDSEAARRTPDPLVTLLRTALLACYTAALGRHPR